MMTMNDYLARERRLHPEGNANDREKFTLQASFGPRHAVRNPAEAWQDLADEARVARATGTLYEVLSPDWARVNIADWLSSGFSLDDLARLFIASCALSPNSPALSVPHHSARYRELYQPHYRVVSLALLPFLVRVAALKAALSQLPRQSVMSLDGEAGSGKTTLAHEVSSSDVALLPADAFFPDPRQPEDDDEAHVLAAKRITPLLESFKQGTLFAYEAYDCHDGTRHVISLPPARVLLFEGSYSSSALFASAVTKRAWLTAPSSRLSSVRLARGKEWCDRFTRDWGVKEESYRTREHPIAIVDLLL